MQLDQFHPQRTCVTCGNEKRNRLYKVCEMMLGTRREFPYLECLACGCLQLMSTPTSMAEFYPKGYYSFHAGKDRTWFTGNLQKIKNRSYFGRLSALGRIWDRCRPYAQLRSFATLRADKAAKILDVGCGSGKLVRDLRALGFKNVLGIDPYMENAIEWKGRAVVKRCSLEDMSETGWDIVMFHHSFEHFAQQRQAFETVRRLLSPGGTCLVRIPVVSWAWHQYGINWVQIDAPRHFVLHTEKSFNMLAQQTGLAVREVRYDSTEFQFWGSELHARGISTGSAEPSHFFSRKQLTEFRTHARQLNHQHSGDQATFYLSGS